MECANSMRQSAKRRQGKTRGEKDVRNSCLHTPEAERVACEETLSTQHAGCPFVDSFHPAPACSLSSSVFALMKQGQYRSDTMVLLASSY